MTNKKISIKKGSIQILLGIWEHLSKRRRVQLVIFSVLNLLSSFSEVFTITMTLPLISVLIDPNQMWRILWIQKIFSPFGINEPDHLITPITIVFIVASLLSTFIKLLILRTNNFFAAAIGNDISSLIYKRILNLPYEKQIEMNSSEAISAATNFADSAREVIYSCLNFLSYAYFVLTIEITLFIFNWKVALTSIFVFAFSYWIVSYKSKLMILKNGKAIAIFGKERVKSIQEGLGSIRDILLGSKQKIFTDNYSKIDLDYRRKSASNKFITFSPRYIIENIGFIFLAIIAYILAYGEKGGNNILPVLGTFAVASQKLIPSMQQCYNSIGTIRSSKSSVERVISILNQKNDIFDSKDVKPFNFRSHIKLSNISFKYPNSDKLILNNIDLEIKKGDRIGIIGTTGSGKSTFADIVMGLLKPISGIISIDNVNLYSKKNLLNVLNWRRAISHVPQNIYLLDSTIAENIAFGIPFSEIDLEKVKKAAIDSKIDHFINGTKNKYLTKIGENGVKLSGGERQRIGIARALYHNSKIIVFDEATSALDDKTESKVISSLNQLDKDLTVIIIAHRLTTLEICNRVLKFEGSKIHEIIL